MTDELVGGCGPHEVRVLINPRACFLALYQLQTHIGRLFRELEELRLALDTWVKHTANNNDIGTLGSNPLLHIGGRGLLRRASETVVRWTPAASATSCILGGFSLFILR
jgi:hypothetical protein